VTAPRSLSVALAIGLRSLRILRKQPPRALPAVLIPLLMFTAFTGSLSGLTGTTGFGYYDYTAFEFVFLLYMASILVGVFASFDLAHDYETGVGTRFMLAAPQRLAIVLGYLLVSVSRWVLTTGVVWAVVLAVGMPVRGDALDVIGFILLALLLNVATTLYGAGVALRLKSTAAGALIFITVFMALFLTPVFVPRDELSGWLHTAADINPLTPALEAGRGLLAHDPVRLAAAYGATGGLVVFFAVWAALGMREAERGPSSSRLRRRRSA
jgi:ABC-2 type transport system permease protein